MPRSNSGTRIAHIPSHLFLETRAVEVADANCRPAELSHHFGELPICARGTLALWHLEQFRPSKGRKV
jgi:hypothetical protein